ncbi:hypothetical protein FIU86_00485 [Roseovarius sp. THAF9]|uniref:TIGR02117 family protein n=1 Tax=Roseovarius sp. THAF9 TaxID=2587847 RepID=UPI0012AA1257|nr:TIGR02117 family protein [Roseovarius sp. THAF9]QFT91303.1 hypothetical protein FIU86_00485 [Roseovarius sp. THAF9]
MLAILALICLYLVSAVAGALVPGPLSPNPSADGGPPIEIRMVAGPIHYDLLLPLTPRTQARFFHLEKAGLLLSDPKAEWLVIGWGSRAFYTHEGSYSDVPAATLWRAMTGDDAVLRADVIGPLPRGYDSPRLMLTPAQYSGLMTAILQQLAPNADDDATPLSALGFTDTDIFFEATGRFHIFRTCNTWISRTLRSAGIPFGAWTPTPYAVTLSHRRFHPG